MGLLTNLAMLLISLAGFLVGFILSIISPEELRPGKKYFIFIQRVLFISITLTSIYLIILLQQYYLLIIPLIFSILFLILTKKKIIKNYFYLKEISNYFFFIIIYFITIEQNLKLLFLSLFFLYGLPAGTLLRLGFIRKQERKHENKKCLKKI